MAKRVINFEKIRGQTLDKIEKFGKIKSCFFVFLFFYTPFKIGKW